MSKHEEFPALTPEAKESLAAAYKVGFMLHDNDFTERNRKVQAAFLREAMEQAFASAFSKRGFVGCWGLLGKIADNLHSPPPPPPPTLAQAREANLDTPEGRDAVRAFLATLGEGVQP